MLLLLLIDHSTQLNTNCMVSHASQYFLWQKLDSVELSRPLQDFNNVFQLAVGVLFCNNYDIVTKNSIVLQTTYARTYDT